MDAVRRFGIVGALTLAAAVGCSVPDRPTSLYPGTFGGTKEEQTRAFAESSTAAYQSGAKVNAPVARPQAPADPPAPVVPLAGPDFAQANTQVRVVATVGTDTVITDDEVWQLVRQRAAEYVKLTGDGRAAKENEVFREELRKVIERELIIADFLEKVKKNKPQAVDEIKDEAKGQAARRLKDFRKANGVRSEEEFQQMLKAQGLSHKGLLRQLERDALSQMYVGQLLKERNKAVSLADVERYYADHKDEFKVDDRAKWLDLFVSYRYFATPAEARQHADKLLAQARAGADFVALVKQHGHGDSKLRDGAGIGEKRGEVKPPELEAAVFALQAGQVSDLIPTENGIHILKVVERDVAGVRPFDQKVQSFIRMKLTALAQKAEYEKLIDDLWRKKLAKVVE
ncbi:MAG: peptidyl-prolyl cis-trans isomerase [Gemmataceae bacterium]